MAYHYYVPFVVNYCRNFIRPKIMEIGIDDGTTLFSLIQRFTTLGNLSEDMKTQAFEYVGIDVDIKPHISNTVHLMARTQADHTIYLIELNSLEFLPSLVAGKFACEVIDAVYEPDQAFTVIMIDGDHNYYTVSQELTLVSQLANENTLIICDDYYGKYGRTDMFYSQRESHAHVDSTTPCNVESMNPGKAGVADAVDEFLEDNPMWTILQHFGAGVDGHPPAHRQDSVFLYHKNNEVLPNIIRGGSIPGNLAEAINSHFVMEMATSTSATVCLESNGLTRVDGEILKRVPPVGERILGHVESDNIADPILHGFEHAILPLSDR